MADLTMPKDESFVPICFPKLHEIYFLRYLRIDNKYGALEAVRKCLIFMNGGEKTRTKYISINSRLVSRCTFLIQFF